MKKSRDIVARGKVIKVVAAMSVQKDEKTTTDFSVLQLFFIISKIQDSKQKIKLSAYPQNCSEIGSLQLQNKI